MDDDRQIQQTTTAVANNLADILERVLDKGIVIAGDIRIQLADVDLLNIKIRLLVTSVDRAKELGIDWWKQDTFYSSLGSRRLERLQKENDRLRKQLEGHGKKVLAQAQDRQPRSASRSSQKRAGRGRSSQSKKAG